MIIDHRAWRARSARKALEQETTTNRTRRLGAGLRKLPYRASK